MRALPRRGVAIRALCLACVVRGVAGGTLPVPLQRLLGGMTVLACHATTRSNVDIVPERDVARARGIGYLQVQRQPNRSLDRDVVGTMALRAGQRSRRVMMACRAIPWRTHACRAMRGTSAVTAAAGQILVALVRKASPDERVTGALRSRVRTRGA